MIFSCKNEAEPSDFCKIADRIVRFLMSFLLRFFSVTSIPLIVSEVDLRHFLSLLFHPTIV